jgi:hypothetical protein
MNRLLTTTAIVFFLGLSPALAVEDSSNMQDQPGSGTEAGQLPSSAPEEQSSVPPSGDPSTFKAPPSSGAGPSGGVYSAPQSSDIKE